MSKEFEELMEKLENTKELLMEKIEILNRLEESSTYIDDHTGKEKKLYAVGILVSQESRLVLIYENSKFCLNGLYINKEDDKIHLSQCTEAGIMNTRDYLLDESVRDYNNSCNFDTKKIKTICFPNGEVKYFRLKD